MSISVVDRDANSLEVVRAVRFETSKGILPEIKKAGTFIGWSYDLNANEAGVEAARTR